MLRLIELIPPRKLVSNAYLCAAKALLPKSLNSDSPLRPTQPFAVYSQLLLIALYLPSSISTPSSPICTFAAVSLIQAQEWTTSAYHLPSAEEYLRSCWQVLFKASNARNEQLELIEAALGGRSLEAKRQALEQLAALVDRDQSIVAIVHQTLQRTVLDRDQAGDIRVGAAEILRFSTSTFEEAATFADFKDVYEQTTDVPLREALVPVLAGGANSESERSTVLEMIERWSRTSEVSLSICLQRSQTGLTTPLNLVVCGFSRIRCTRLGDTSALHRNGTFIRRAAISLLSVCCPPLAR